MKLHYSNLLHQLLTHSLTYLKQSACSDWLIYHLLFALVCILLTCVLINN